MVVLEDDIYIILTLKNMGNLIISRKKGIDISPVNIEINDIKFYLEWGENRKINLTSGRYKIRANGLFGLKGYAEIEVKEDTPTTVTLRQILPNEYTLIAISILLLLFILSYIELISIIVFSWYSIFCIILFPIYSIAKRRKYYRFEVES